ncbi:unnamed protein product [Chrysoparadoxa australica]
MARMVHGQGAEMEGHKRAAGLVPTKRKMKAWELDPTELAAWVEAFPTSKALMGEQRLKGPPKGRAQPDMDAAFMRHVELSLCIESYIFLKAVSRYKLIPRFEFESNGEKAIASFNKIVQDFIAEDGYLQINIAPEMRAQILQCYSLDLGTRRKMAVFDQAEAEIRKLLEQYLVTPFHQSEPFARICRGLKEEQKDVEEQLPEPKSISLKARNADASQKRERLSEMHRARGGRATLTGSSRSFISSSRRSLVEPAPSQPQSTEDALAQPDRSSISRNEDSRRSTTLGSSYGSLPVRSPDARGSLVIGSSSGEERVPQASLTEHRPSMILPAPHPNRPRSTKESSVRRQSITSKVQPKSPATVGRKSQRAVLPTEGNTTMVQQRSPRNLPPIVTVERKVALKGKTMEK